MIWPDVRPVAGLCVLLACVLGCGDSSSPSPVSQPSTGPQAVKLPDLDPPFGPLDTDRVSVPPPNGWIISPRSSEWVIRFQASPTLSYPTIIVTAEDYPAMLNVSADNVGDFSRQIAAALAADGTKLAKKVSPTKLGNRPYATYQRLGRAGQVVLERMFLDTVVAGRKYNLELRTPEGTIDKYKPYLLAVAGGTQFHEAAEPQTAEPQAAVSSEPPVSTEPVVSSEPAAAAQPEPPAEATTEEPAATEPAPAMPAQTEPAPSKPTEQPAAKPATKPAQQKPKKESKFDFEDELK